MYQDLIEKKEKLAVIGLGYVGLPIALEFAKKLSVIGFDINEDGTTTNHRIVKELGGGTGQEALRVVKLLKFRKPGYKFQTSVPVIFKL